ncbi:uncharacterized protein SCHCODRAFT_02542664 [Schizophyllum commune H4-8]|nr:uncharacterized protein SCHCODRAFT_02542664 [Schizophyllum commune H4-8]KAI5892622.1 hypothetical protein SCHCODRAFT_02542664 [Schizophyllum commune H4-8]
MATLTGSSSDAAVPNRGSATDALQGTSPTSPQEDFEAAYQNLLNALLWKNLANYTAVVLPTSVLYTLATRGRSALTVQGITDHASIYGYLPAYISSAFEPLALFPGGKPVSTEDLRKAYARIFETEAGKSLFNHWICGFGLGFLFAIFGRRPTRAPTTGRMAGWAMEKLDTISMIVDMPICGGAIGALVHYCKRGAELVKPYGNLSLTDAMERLARIISGIDWPWLRDYTSIQLWSGLKIVTTSSLAAIPSITFFLPFQSSSVIPRLLARHAAFWTFEGLLIGAPIVHSALSECTHIQIREMRQQIFEGPEASLWNRYIAVGAALGCSSLPFLVKRSPTFPLVRDFVRDGRFLKTPRNIITLGGTAMLLGGGLGSATYLARIGRSPSH